ncbi:MAG TPA: hypothetical protein VJS63_06615 [Bradyrhizobium sp.]|nr:hypothetical protein [Bradyrhizobium sp.]
MKTTAAKFVSAIFASIVASSTLTAAPDNEEKTGDNCLLGPSASTPPGGHWYYRVDRANKRNCWYMRLEKDKVARKPAVEDTARAEQAVVPAPPKPAPQRSISDARAELTPPQAPLEQDARMVATQRIPAAPADVPRGDNAPRSGAGDSSLLSSAVASRWPDPLAVAASPPAPAKVAEAQPQAAPAAPPPRPASVPVPAADAGAPALSLPMLLTVLVGALSVIAVIGGAIFGRGNRRSTRLSPSAPMPPFDFAEQPRAPDDPRRRIERMMAQINSRAAA